MSDDRPAPTSRTTGAARPVVVIALADDRSDDGRPLRDLPEELRAIRDKLDGPATLEIRHNAMLREVWEVFERPKYQGRIQVFHFAGHASGSWLAFEDARGIPVRAGAGGLAGFLGRQPGMVLVFLNGCSTLEQVRKLRLKIPAVIATSDAIRDDVASAFAGRFYAGLVSKPLRRAFEDAEDFIKATFGDDPHAVTRDARPESDGTTAQWPWRLDCDERYETWRLGGTRPTDTVSTEPTPPGFESASPSTEPTSVRARLSELVRIGLSVLAIGGVAWRTLHRSTTPPPFEMTAIPGESVRLCSDGIRADCPRVEVPPFCLSTHEITQAQWTQLSGSNPSVFQSETLPLPVNNITWVDALRLANRLSEREGLTSCYASTPEGWLAQPSCNGYRLPTAKEWARLMLEPGAAATCANANVADVDFQEHASQLEEHYRTRAGDILPFDCEHEGEGDGHGGLAPVGSMEPGPFGLKDLQGNVTEWVWDESRGVVIVRGHSFAGPGRNDWELRDPSPREFRASTRDGTIGVRYARDATIDDAEGTPRCHS